MADSPLTNHSILIPGPPFHIDLAPLDALHPIHYSRRLLLFHCTSSTQREAQLSALKAGLQALIQRCPLLAGTIAPLPPNEVSPNLKDWRTIVPGPGLEFVVRDLRDQLPSFEKLEAEGFPPLDLPYEELVPVPGDLGNEIPFAACKVQFSAVEGGSILSWAMSHSVADGSGNNEFFRLLSEEVRMAQENLGKGLGSDGLVKPSTINATEHLGEDRSLLRNITSERVFNIEEHPAFRLLPTPTSPSQPAQTPEQRSTHPLKATEPEIPVLIHISPAGLAQLKADATTPNASPISTHDALTALIWRSTLLVRSCCRHPTSSLTESKIFLPSDARKHLGLPESYLGNAVYQLTASLDLGTLLAPSGLKSAASAVRKAISAVNAEGVRSYMTELRERWVEWGFMGMTAADVAMGTDWSSGGIYGDDWGEVFGKRVVRFRYPGERGAVAGAVVLPKLVDGSAEVVVGVMESEVEMLMGKECFGKYLEDR